MPSTTTWITGLSGAGKTTLATALVEHLRQRGRAVVLIDGDVIRDLFGPSLGYDVAARRTQIGRLQALAKLISGQGVDVVVAALYSAPDLLARNREHLGSYVEVDLKASLDLVRRRNSKQLYDGATQNVVGLDIERLEPQEPNITVDMDREDTPEDIAASVLEHLPDIGVPLD